MLQDIAEDVERDRYVARLNIGEEGGLFAGGVRVEASAHILDLHLKRLSVGPAPSALEGHVLEEVRGAVSSRELEAAARVDPDADGGHPGGGRVRLRDDAEARGERRDARVGEAEVRGVVGGAGNRRGVAEEAAGGGERGGGGGAGVEKATEIGDEPAPRAVGGGESSHVVFDGIPRAAALCGEKKSLFPSPIILAAGEGLPPT